MGMPSIGNSHKPFSRYEDGGFDTPSPSQAYTGEGIITAPSPSFHPTHYGDWLGNSLKAIMKKTCIGAMKATIILSIVMLESPLFAEDNPPAVMTPDQAFTQMVRDLKSPDKANQTRGFIKMQQAASGGNPKAEYNFGALYHEGLGTAQNFVQARYWIEKSAEQGYPAAEALLGNIYHFGRTGIPEDLEKAFYWTEKAANHGVVSAQRDLALIYHQRALAHKISPLDGQQKALYWMEKAADRGDSEAKFQMANVYLSGIPNLPQYAADNEKAFSLCKDAAEKGHLKAAALLGEMYYSGDGGEVDQKAGFYWTEKAARLGDPFAEYNMARFYNPQNGNQRIDPDTAFYWMEKSANHNFHPAESALGRFYRDGQGTGKNPDKAFYWYYRAAAGGNLQGQFDLAMAYYRGEGTEKDPKKAFYWCEKAANQGMEEAEEQLALMYHRGIGTPKDDDSAAKWYQKAWAEHHFDNPATVMGDLYFKGQKIDRNYKKAFDWYQKAAKDNDIKAENAIGNMYYSGLAVPQDFQQALFWYRKATAPFYALADDAEKKLGDMYYHGQAVPQDFNQAFSWYLRAGRHHNKDAEIILSNLYKKGIGVKKNEEQAVYWHRKAFDKNFAAIDDMMDNHAQGMSILNRAAEEKAEKEAASPDKKSEPTS